MSDQRLLQFAGLVGSGKSTLARKLAHQEGGMVVSFASKVYSLVELVVGGPVDKTDPWHRELLKLMGTEWGRDGEAPPPHVWSQIRDHLPSRWGKSDVWARDLVDLCRSREDVPLIANDDLRFCNELVLSQQAGFIPFLVACRPAIRLQRLAGRGEMYDGNDPTHESEILVNALYDAALKDNLLPVIWVDHDAFRPATTWVYRVEEFMSLVAMSTTQQECADVIGWTPKRRERLIEFAIAVSSGLDRSPRAQVLK